MDSFMSTVGHFNATLHGVIVSSILITAAVTSLISGNVADVYGRPKAMMFGGAIFGIGTALEASAQNLAMFMCGRVLAGIGDGFTLSLPVVYICEISPAKRRGPLASLPQFCTVVGLASGYFICYGTSRINTSSASWRASLALQSLLGFAFSLCCTLVPHTPRWLLTQARPSDAAHVSAQLGLPADDNDTSSPITTSPPPPPHPSPPTSLATTLHRTLTDLTRALSPKTRHRTLLGAFLMAMQQFSGIDGLLFYAPLLFARAGLASSTASFLASGVSALAILATTVPATLFCDAWGRRAATLWGGAVLAACMVLIGAVYAAGAGDEGRAGRWVVVAAIYGFAVAYSGTWAVVLKLYAPEIVAPGVRAGAASLAQGANCVSFFPPCFPRLLPFLRI